MVRSLQYVLKVWGPDVSLKRYHTHPKFLPFPAKHIALRGAQEEKYAVVDVTRQSGGSANIIEEVEISRALFELYEGGVVCFINSFLIVCPIHTPPQFIHQGLTYIVRKQVLYLAS